MGSSRQVCHFLAGEPHSTCTKWRVRLSRTPQNSCQYTRDASGSQGPPLFRPVVANKLMLVRCDNTTVVAYINHQGGTRSAKLCALTWKLIHWCILHKVTLSAAHLPGKENVTADALSRGWVVPTEWTLHPQVAHSLFLMIDWPHVDLFASRTNHQLPVYCSRTHDPYAWQTDALAIRWDGLLAYAFPHSPSSLRY